MNPVAQLRSISDGTRGNSYQAIVLWCPGCEQPAEDGEMHGGLHMLPVTGAGRPTWSFDGNLEAPTLSPSILTRYEHARRRRVAGGELEDVGLFVCHSYLRAGVWEFLGDCTHELAGQRVPAVPLPDWVVRE